MGEQFDANSSPNSSTISNWITEAEAEIDLMTGTSFTTNTVSNEYYDLLDGSDWVVLKKRPIISVTALAYNENGLGETANWVTLTEGYENDFLLYKEQGRISIHSKTYSIPAGYQNIKVSYTWGKATVPATVQKLATLMVCERILDQKMKQSRKKSPLDLTLGELSIRHSRDAIITQKQVAMDELKSLVGNLGKMKVYMDMYN